MELVTNRKTTVVDRLWSKESFKLEVAYKYQYLTVCQILFTVLVTMHVYHDYSLHLQNGILFLIFILFVRLLVQGSSDIETLGVDKRS